MKRVSLKWCIMAATMPLIAVAMIFLSAKEQRSAAADGTALLPNAAPPAPAAASASVSAGFGQVAENETLILYLDRETTEIAVKDKRSGTIWYSNPSDRSADPVATPENKDRLGSQFTVTFYNSKNQAIQYNNFAGSIRHGQFDIIPQDDGVKIVYTLGDVSKGIDAIPKRISKARFETEILARIEDEADRDYVAGRFQLRESEGVYERYDAEFSPLVLRKVSGILEAIGYGEEQLQIDNAAHQTDVSEAAAKPRFTVPIVYTLDGDSLVVTVPVEEVAYHEAFPIHTLSVLDYFGAAGRQAEGYLFVPDGSGALIGLNNGKLAYDPLSLPVYGSDNTRDVGEVVQKSEPVRLPVYGMKQGTSGWMAIIEDGEAAASIEADIAGRLNGYNYVYAKFALKARDEITLQGGMRSSTVSVFQEGEVQGDIRVRYIPLQEADADYSGMARVYRDRLAGQYGMDRLASAAHTPFYLELIGAVDERKTFLGIPYRSLLPLTTFSEAERIVRRLADAGVAHMAVRYSGWFNGGYDHTLPTSVSPERALGGASGLQALNRSLAELGVALYPDVAFLNVMRDSRDFRPREHAARLLNKRPARKYPISLPTFQADRTRPPYWLLSPGELEKTVGRFDRSYAEYGIDGLSLRDLASQVHSDFRRGKTVDRQQAVRLAERELGRLDEGYSGLMAAGGNRYAIPYVDHLLEVPLQSSGFYLTDDSVPFVPMVLHGFVDYAGQPFNASADQSAHRAMLKAIETGANVYYRWFYAGNSAVIQTEYTRFYAMHYENWLEEAVRVYTEIDKVLAPVRNQAIVKHEKLGEGVYRTVYESGYYTIVNYNPHPVDVEGTAIAAESYTAGGGGA